MHERTTTDDRWSPEATRLLLLICRAYDAAIVTAGLAAAATGHVGGGAGIAGIGLVAMVSTLVLGPSGRRLRRPPMRRPARMAGDPPPQPAPVSS